MNPEENPLRRLATADFVDSKAVAFEERAHLVKCVLTNRVVAVVLLAAVTRDAALHSEA